MSLSFVQLERSLPLHQLCNFDMIRSRNIKNGENKADWNFFVFGIRI